MRGLASLLGIVVALGAGYFIYERAAARDGTAQAPPPQQIDVVAIKAELLAVGQAERQYLVAHSTYGTLDQLRSEQLLTGEADQRGYIFSVAVDGSRRFTATATPTDPGKSGWPSFTMNETMQVGEQ
jgi:hypothetical protein